MSILIRGMTMPKRCGECPCFHADNPMYCQAVKADKNKKIIAPYGKPRPEWCPLIEIPPHGRLIDGDVAEAIYFTDGDADGKDFYDGILYAAGFISRQPTIIEAEGGE